MSAFKRIAVAAAASAAMVLAVSGAAWAAPPPNDTFAGATVVPSVPYTATEDTTQATLDSADTAAAQACNTPGGFTFSNSVWFAYTPTSNQTLGLDTSQSNYSVAGAVLTGSPAGFTPVSCFLTSTSFQATAGTTYYIDLLEFGAGSGGTLNLSLTQLTSPNPVVTVNPIGEFDPFTGGAVISGTESCSNGANAFLFAMVSTQAHGRNAAITGFGSPLAPLVCDGTAHPWSAVISPTSGLFKGGPVSAEVFMDACGFICQTAEVTQTVRLRH